MYKKTKDADQQCADDVFCGVNMVSDPAGASDTEKMHMPVIKAPRKVKKNECFEVTVEIGNPTRHPCEPDHFVQFIELYAGDTYLARMDFSPEATCPVMKTCVSLTHGHGALRAFGRCNKYGTWESDVPIEVTD